MKANLHKRKRTSTSSNQNGNQEQEKNQLISYISIQDGDVLLGRGKSYMNHPGNIRFRGTDEYLVTITSILPG